MGFYCSTVPLQVETAAGLFAELMNLDFAGMPVPTSTLREIK